MNKQNTAEWFPTHALPGSEEKQEVLAARYAAGQPLFHPLDRTGDEPEEEFGAAEVAARERVLAGSNETDSESEAGDWDE